MYSIISIEEKKERVNSSINNNNNNNSVHKFLLRKGLTDTE